MRDRVSPFPPPARFLSPSAAMEGAIPVRAAALGEAVVHLPWLPPSADSLVALAWPGGTAAWPELCQDPGALLLLASSCPRGPTAISSSFFPRAQNAPSLFDRALERLDRPDAAFVDWSQEEVRPIYQAALAYARLARSVAQATNTCDPDSAWAAGLLAPLGWLAVCAVDPESVVACLADMARGEDARGVQRRHWGLEQSALARRLARRWRLPAWLAATSGQLDLPQGTEHPAEDASVIRVTRLAVALAQGHASRLQLVTGGTVEEAAAELGLAPAALESLRDSAPQALAASTKPWSAPRGLPLLRPLLFLAAENRRLLDAPVLEDLESEVDRLQVALRDQRAGEEARLRTRKLAALAEFAAGAGHEINNPLAVISGQAQYLLQHEPEPGRQRALQTIIGQATRIHQLLADLMQFARPPRPEREPVDAYGLVREVAGSLQEMAGHRRVQIVCPPPRQLARLDADPRQARAALAGLLRNAIEAASPDGWAAVRLEVPAPGIAEFVVEDSGPGPDPMQREHLFDPFFSGRQAGRGRGLGLPTAWRLARGHGGDIRLDASLDGPTRFVLSLPTLPDMDSEPPPQVSDDATVGAEPRSEDPRAA